MKLNVKLWKRAVVVSALLGFWLFPSLGEAAGVTVQTAGNKSNAAVGESGATIGSSALITVVVTKTSTGLPVTTLGADVGDGTSGITLPAGWTLFTNANVPPGGCLMSPTEFTNWGNGTYSIRVVPFLPGPDCTWLSGDYHYVVTIDTAGPSLKGSGLGVLSIP
jgi:hypothetical protein